MFKHVLSPQLYMEPVDRHHIPALFAETDRSRASLSPWLPWAPHHTIANTRDYVEGKLRQHAEGRGFDCVIFYEGEVAGVVGHVGIRGRRSELGYWLGDRFVGKGIMTSCVRAVTQDAFQRLRLHRLEILCHKDNLRSRAIPERLGFQLEALMRGWICTENETADVALYARLATDL